jgi:hypothetical protein
LPSTRRAALEHTRINPANTLQAVPDYGKPAPARVEKATLVPSLTHPAAQKPEEKKPAGPSKPKGKSREQKLWEAHLDAGIGGTDFEQPEQKPGTQLAGMTGGAGGCFLPPTVPMTMQIENAGYTERGGMINGLIVQPALGMGMHCTVLPTGTRVTMEFWGEPGDAQIVEIGFPTFIVPGLGAVQPQPITGMPPDASNRELPDHLSGWVMTPTFSLDAGDVVTLHLRGVLNAVH